MQSGHTHANESDLEHQYPTRRAAAESAYRRRSVRRNSLRISGSCLHRTWSRTAQHAQRNERNEASKEESARAHHAGSRGLRLAAATAGDGVRELASGTRKASLAGAETIPSEALAAGAAPTASSAGRRAAGARVAAGTEAVRSTGSAHGHRALARQLARHVELVLPAAAKTNTKLTVTGYLNIAVPT